MPQYGSYPASGGGSGSIPTYPNAAALPAIASDGELGITLDTHSLYEYNAGLVSWQLLATANNTVVSVGAIDSQTKSANGAVINANSIFMQTADGTSPGLVSTAAQTFAGDKTFSDHIVNTSLTASRAMVTSAGSILTTSTTTAAELAFVSGVTSSIQTQLNGKQASGNYITALTGDGTAAGPGFAALTLATVNSNVGTFAVQTVNGKGLVTAATTLTGDITSSGAATTLATVNSNVGSFGSSTSIPTFTVNAKGLITAASGNAVIAPAGTLSGTVLNSTVVTSSLTTVGTIATGVWQGTAVDATHGGTNQTTYATGDTLYASATNTLSKLAGNTTTTLKFLGQTGNGSVSAAPVWTAFTAPTVQVFTSSSGTYTTPAGCTQIRVRMIGGGGGGGSNGTSGTVNGGTGGNTTFAGNTAAGGSGGAASSAAVIQPGATGNANTFAAGTQILNIAGAAGNVASTGGASPTANGTSGSGAGGVFGGGGKSVSGSTNGVAGTAPGAGGGGGGGTSSVFGGPGGASGGYLEFLITGPSATYSYAVGAAGTAGTGAQNGGAGFAGIIIVDEFYN